MHTRLLVDATDCPVKPEIYRLAERYGTRVLLVSEKELGTPFEPWLTKVVVDADQLERTIADEAHPEDIVVTDNPTLAGFVLTSKGYALTTRGQKWTAQGPHPKLPENSRNNNRARFLTVLEEELKNRLLGRSDK